MKLLIIDDDEICSYINVRVAQTCGIFEEVNSVHNGRAALDFLRNVSEGGGPGPDMILLDLDMPLVNGFDFMRALNGLSFSNKEKLKVVVLTSSTHPQDIEQAQSLGIDHYLKKPLTVNALQNTLFALRKAASPAQKG